MYDDFDPSAAVAEHPSSDDDSSDDEKADESTAQEEPTEPEPEYSMYQDSWGFDLLPGFTRPLPSPVKPPAWTAEKQKALDDCIYSPPPSTKFWPKKMVEQTWPSARLNEYTSESASRCSPCKRCRVGEYTIRAATIWCNPRRRCRGGNYTNMQ